MTLEIVFKILSKVNIAIIEDSVEWVSLYDMDYPYTTQCLADPRDVFNTLHRHFVNTYGDNSSKATYMAKVIESLTDDDTEIDMSSLEFRNCDLIKIKDNIKAERIAGQTGYLKGYINHKYCIVWFVDKGFKTKVLVNNIAGKADCGYEPPKYKYKVTYKYVHNAVVEDITVVGESRYWAIKEAKKANKGYKIEIVTTKKLELVES